MMVQPRAAAAGAAAPPKASARLLHHAAAAGTAAPPKASATKVATTAVLTNAARKRAKALFRSKARRLLRSSGDASIGGAAAPAAAVRHRLDSVRKAFPYDSRHRLDRERLALRRCLQGVARGTEQTPGSRRKSASALFRRGGCEYRSGCHFSGRRPGSAAVPNARGCDVAV